MPDASAAPVQNMGTLPTRVRNFAITLSGPDQGFIRPRIELYDALIESYEGLEVPGAVNTPG